MEKAEREGERERERKREKPGVKLFIIFVRKPISR